MVVSLKIPDDVMANAGLNEKGLRIELACALFAQRKIELWPAAQLAGLSRIEMEDELMTRKIPIYYVDEEYMAQEFKALEKMRAMDGDRRQ